MALGLSKPETEIMLAHSGNILPLNLVKNNVLLEQNECEIAIHRLPLVCVLRFGLESFKYPIRLETQSRDPISCCGKPVEGTNEITHFFSFIGLFHCFPVATDRVVGQKVDRGLYGTEPHIFR